MADSPIKLKYKTMKWNNQATTMARFCGKKSQLFLAETLRKKMEKRVPKYSGDLQKTAKATATAENGRITYPMQYAAYQYDNKLNHSGSRNPSAVDHWDRATWEADGAGIVREMQGFIDAQ